MQLLWQMFAYHTKPKAYVKVLKNDRIKKNCRNCKKFS